jgi:four helix bundle protein
MGDYRRLRVWKAARLLVEEVYRATAWMPLDERFGLTSQLRRAAVSILANVAEGAGRSGDRELRRFVGIARGSAHELICELELTERLGMLNRETVSPLLDQARGVAAMLTRLHDVLGAEHQRAR